MMSLRRSGSVFSSLARKHTRSPAVVGLLTGGEPTTMIMTTTQQPLVLFDQQQVRGFKSVPRRSRSGFYSQQRIRSPTLTDAKNMPLHPGEMDNVTLVTLGELGNYQARKEILKRHIMCRDRVSYGRACETYAKIRAKNTEYVSLLSLPYKIGITMGVGAACAAIPMVFDLSTAEFFNHHFVTTDIPEPKDLETMWEVGSWTWNWMEPPLGTISFVLLALQFSRAQLQNLGIKPYTARVKQWRGERLAKAFPQYDAEILIDYSRSSTLRNAERNS